MFTPLGLFKDIPCPQGETCCLLTCIFSHDAVVVGSHLASPTSSRDEHVVSGDTSTTTSSSIATPSIQQPSKRIKLETTPDTSSTSSTEGTKKSLLLPSRKNDSYNQGNNTEPSKSGEFASPMNKEPHQESSGDAVKLQSTTSKKDVSLPPTPTRGDTKATSPKKVKPSGHLLPRNAPKESLNPRMLAKAPASHAVRTSILTKLHAAMSALNDKVASGNKDTERYLILSPDELVTMALDEEEKVAKENSNVYANIIKLRVVKLSKMSEEDWLEEVKAHLNSRYYREHIR